MTYFDSRQDRRETLRGEIIDKVIKHVLPEELIDERTKIFINETGSIIPSVLLELAK